MENDPVRTERWQYGRLVVVLAERVTAIRVSLTADTGQLVRHANGIVKALQHSNEISVNVHARVSELGNRDGGSSLQFFEITELVTSKTQRRVITILLRNVSLQAKQWGTS